MKSCATIFILFFLISTPSLIAQQNYNVDGQTYTLKTEVEGPLTLLWNTFDGNYRYFLKQNVEVVELKNTKVDGNYQEEYKVVLAEKTKGSGIDTESLKFNLSSLHNYFVEYNQKIDPNFTDEKTNTNIQLRLGGFAGVSNSVFTNNINDALHPVVGVDFEIFEEVKLKRHALVFRFKQTFESSDHKYSASQLSLNYRFKFVKTSKFDAFVNCKLASFTYSTKEITYVIETNPPMIINETNSGSDFNAPITFGIGADYKVGKNYITFNYNDIVGLNVENNGNFPIDFTVGYKFSL